MPFADVLQEVSGNLLLDQRILSSQEKELLSDLLAKIQSRSPDGVLEPNIVRAVGEIVSERMSSALGNSVVRELLAKASQRSQVVYRADGPRPPGPTPPGPPGPHSLPRPASPKSPGPGFKPGEGPRPPGPTPPGPHALALISAGPYDKGEFLPAHCVTLPEFLAPQELQSIIQHTLEHEADFRFSEVVAPGVPGGTVDYERRRSRVLTDLGELRDLLLDRMKLAWPLILKQLRHPGFPISSAEIQITASNDGDFFRWHSDNGQPEIENREVTFVYFFHREPKQFSGGELRIFDSHWDNGGYVPGAHYRSIVPEQNQLVLFASALTHEITPVNCPSGAFADSRFTVNGWFHR